MYHSKLDRKKEKEESERKLRELDNTPISVNSNVTPITYETITTVRSDLWDNRDVPVDFLHNQLYVLQQRRSAVGNNQPLVEMLNNGIARITAIIDRRSE